MSEEKTGEEMIAESLAALETGEDLPYQDEAEVEDVAEDVTPEVADEPEEDSYAEKDGYMSEEDWVKSGKDAEDYLDKDEFEAVGKLRDNRDEYTRQDLAKSNIQLQKSVKEMMANNQRMIAEATERARADERAKLEAAQKEAIEYGNAEEAVELQKQMDSYNQPKPVQQQVQVEPSVQQFFEKNKDWYGVAQGATELLNVHLGRAEQQGLSFDEAVKLALPKVNQAYPGLVGDTPPKAQKNLRPRQNSEKSAAPKTREKKMSLKDLDPGLRVVAARAIRATGMSEHEYVKQIMEG